ncbi:MAG: aldo/keto reductase [Microbacteriaceae bacterium]|jgi:D-threo-aldose 1-dehydrogenase|nr:aldo/keto reductase [Microbacteriaceae bacterium]
MRKRRLPNGLQLTELGLGAAQLGNLYRETTDDEAAGAVAAAWDAGIRYFDTAPHYGLGLSERRLGRLLSGYPREDFVLSTKVGRLLVPNPGATGLDDLGFAVPATRRRQWDFSRDGVRRSIDESLERLGLDRIDIVYLHDPDDHWEQASREAAPALAQLRDEGVIRAFGAGMNQVGMLARFIEECDVDLVMIAGRHTLLEPGGFDRLLPLAEERGVGIVAAGVYNSGLLGSPRPPKDATYDYEPAPPELVRRANRLADICEAHGVSLPEAAIQFPLLEPVVTSVVLGARNRMQVESNVARYEATLPSDLWEDLQRNPSDSVRS